jgi:membrane-associated PAP2 superfamily phosphatase
MGRTEAAVLVALAIATTVVFAVTSLDIVAEYPFYYSHAAEHWPVGARLPWSALYRIAPLLTGCLVLIALAWLMWGLLRQERMLRLYGVFVLLSVALGPGLVVNAVFKDHWDRPRPRDVVEFQGQMSYVPAPLRGAGGGSFPCGHCSVGFLYGLGFWIWRARRPRLAWTSLAVGLAAGTALGIGRMAAGAHFLSDVIWSALLAYGVAHILYYHVLRIPQQQDSTAAPAPTAIPLRWTTVLAVSGALAVLAALFAGPRGSLVSQDFCPTAGQEVRALAATAHVSNMEVLITDSRSPKGAPPSCFVASGELHGFGLPTSHLTSGFTFDPATAQLSYRIEQRGWFTDLSGEVLIRAPAETLSRVSVNVDRGNIKVTDLTRAGAYRSGRLRLELRTGSGLCAPVEACYRAPKAR